MSDRGQEIVKRYAYAIRPKAASPRQVADALAADIQAAMDEEWNEAVEAAIDVTTPYGATVNKDAIRALKRGKEPT